jgi:hypothetical protein
LLGAFAAITGKTCQVRSNLLPMQTDETHLTGLILVLIAKNPLVNNLLRHYYTRSNRFIA